MAGNTDEVGVRLRVKEKRKFNEDIKESERSVRGLGDEHERSSKKVGKFNANMALLRNVTKLIKPAAIITGLGLMVQGMSVAGAGAIALVGALAPLSGAMAAYPALGAAAAQGMGVFHLATLGLGDAVTKEFKNFSQPTHIVNKFAEHLGTLKPQLQSLRDTAQKPFFAGLTKAVDLTSPLLGKMRGVVKGTAGALGDLSVQAALNVRAMGGDLVNVGKNNITLIRNFGNGAINAGNALRHVVVAAQPLVLWMSRLASGWGEALSQAAATGRKTGQMAHFFERTRQVLTLVFSISGAVAKSLWNIGKAGAPLGNTILKDLNTQAERFAKWTSSAAGQQKMAKWFNDAKPAIYEVARLVRDVVKAFFQLSASPGLANMLKTLRTGLLPVLVSVVKSTTTAFGPVLVNAIVAMAQAFQPLLGSSGPLVLFLKLLTTFAHVVAWIEKAIPGGATAMSMLGGAISVLGALGMASFTSNLFGMRRGLDVVKGALDTAALGMESMRLAYVAQGGAANASNAAVLRAAAASKLQAVWSKIAAAATRVWAIAQGIFNAVMALNPIVLVVLAIAALVAAIVLAYMKIAWFRNLVNAVFNWLKTAVVTVINFVKSHWQLIIAIMFGPIGIAVGLVIRNFGRIKSAFGSVVGFLRGAWNAVMGAVRGAAGAAGGVVVGVWRRIRSGFSSVVGGIRGAWNSVMGFFRGAAGKVSGIFSRVWNAIKSTFKGALNAVVSIWNKLHFSIGGWKIDPLIGPTIHVPKITVGMPHIPPLAQGGVIRSTGMAIVGDAGAELLRLPMGARVDPLPSARALSSPTLGGGGVDALDGLDLEDALRQEFHLYIDGEEVAVSVRKHAKRKKARR